MEKETDTDSPLDSSGKVGKQFTSDGAIGETQDLCLPLKTSKLLMPGISGISGSLNCSWDTAGLTSIAYRPGYVLVTCMTLACASVRGSHVSKPELTKEKRVFQLQVERFRRPLRRPRRLARRPRRRPTSEPPKQGCVSSSQRFA